MNLYTTKALALTGVLSVTLFGGGAALAYSSTPAGFKLNDWITTGWNTGGGGSTYVAGQVLDQDKLWTFVSASGVVDTNKLTIGALIETYENNPFPFDTHQLTLNTFGAVAPWTGSIRYSIEVFGVGNPNVLWNTSMGVNVPGANKPSDIKTYFYSDSTFTTLLTDLQVVDGGNDGPDFAVAGFKKVWVQIDIEAKTGGIVNSVSNTFTENLIPEPASLALIGLGLAGLAARTRARKTGD